MKHKHLTILFFLIGFSTSCSFSSASNLSDRRTFPKGHIQIKTKSCGRCHILKNRKPPDGHIEIKTRNCGRCHALPETESSSSDARIMLPELEKIE